MFSYIVLGQALEQGWVQMFLLLRACFVWKEAVQLSFASISCFSPRWGGRGGLTRSWWCFCTTRGCWSQYVCSSAGLAGVGSVPDGTFIATGRERLICHDHCWLLLGCPKISIVKLFIHFPSKCECFTSSAWSRSWPVSEFPGEEPPPGLSQNCCHLRRLLSRMATSVLKISRRV